MTIAILTTGDELIDGDTLNTNGHAIAQALNSEGLSIGLHLSCHDKEQEIVDCLQFLDKNHEIIILVGGLGPTSDDRTRFALASFLNTPLIEFPEAIDHVESRLTRAKLTMNAGNRQQALFPEDAILFPNPDGTAMGCCVKRGLKNLFIMLPGPPRECLPMLNNYALPKLQQADHNKKELLKWRLFGVAEGQIAETLETALSELLPFSTDYETGYRLETPYIEFKVRCHKHDMERIKQKIEPLIQPHVIATVDQKASERLRSVIEQIPARFVIIDDVTGGRLQTLIQRPSNYHKVFFHASGSNDSSMPNDLGLKGSDSLYFYLSGLEGYWKDQTESTTTEIKIEYKYEDKTGSDTSTLAFRSALVVEYAAELLCFRLVHLINQLHQRVT